MKPEPTNFHLDFAKSPRSTVGIEWELGLVDADSGEMRQAAPAIAEVLDAKGEPHPHIQQEFMQNTIELVTGVAKTIPEAGLDLAAAAAEVRDIADPMRVGLMCAGTHPFSHWQSQKITDKERYHTVVDRAQIVGRQIMIFGDHTHVGVESRDKVLPILRALLVYVPHLQALAANSPFWDGLDSGYASIRTVIFGQLPTAGLPYQFDQWDQLEGYIADLIRTGVIENFDEIRWDIRPSCRYGTLEIRVCDGSSNLQELLALSALAQCLVEYHSTLIDQGRPLPSLQPWFVSENKWRAARYGLDAVVITDREGRQLPIKKAIAELVTILGPTAQRLGCVAELDNINVIVARGAGYERQRLAYAKAVEGGATHKEALEAVVAHLVAELRADTPLYP